MCSRADFLREFIEALSRPSDMKRLYSESLSTANITFGIITNVKAVLRFTGCDIQHSLEHAVIQREMLSAGRTSSNTVHASGLA